MNNSDTTTILAMKHFTSIRKAHKHIFPSLLVQMIALFGLVKLAECSATPYYPHLMAADVTDVAPPVLRRSLATCAFDCDRTLECKVQFHFDNPGLVLKRFWLNINIFMALVVFYFMNKLVFLSAVLPFFYRPSLGIPEVSVACWPDSSGS